MKQRLHTDDQTQVRQESILQSFEIPKLHTADLDFTNCGLD